MNFTDLQNKIDEQNFGCIVKEETKSYLKQIEYFNFNEGKDYQKLFLVGLKKYHLKEDKIIYLVESLKYYFEELEELPVKISRIQERRNEQKYNFLLDYEGDLRRYQHFKKVFEVQIFYAVRELEKIGITGLDKNVFSVDEVKVINKKIDSILEALNELKAGQEIIFDHIDEVIGDYSSLKSDYPLGKKRWHQRAAGIVVSYAGEKGADELYDAIKPFLKAFMNLDPGIIHKFLQ